jgi:hypothetical protein
MAGFQGRPMLSQEDATHVLTHVERAKESLKNIREGQVSADGVFIHPRKPCS